MCARGWRNIAKSRSHEWLVGTKMYVLYLILYFPSKIGMCWVPKDNVGTTPPCVNYSPFFPLLRCEEQDEYEREWEGEREGKWQGKRSKPFSHQGPIKIRCITSPSLEGCSERSIYLYVQYILCTIVGSARSFTYSPAHQNSNSWRGFHIAKKVVRLTSVPPPVTSFSKETSSSIIFRSISFSSFQRQDTYLISFLCFSFPSVLSLPPLPVHDLAQQ